MESAALVLFGVLVGLTLRRVRLTADIRPPK